MSEKGNLTDLLQQAMRYALGGAYVCLPARIVSYSHKKQNASVKPVIRRQYTDGVIQDMPVIKNVPVVWPRSGGASLTFPVKRDDYCMLVFADRAIDSWLNQGGESTPNDRRMHSLNDAVAIMGIMPFSDNSKAENNDDVLLTFSDNFLRLKPNGNSEIVSGTSLTLRVGNSTLVMEPDNIRLTSPRIDFN